MSESSEDFFEGKRPWSIIKDDVLRNYMGPYLAKVNKLEKPIWLIDGYAGPGIFDDGTSGSPIIMCEKAEKFVRGNYRATFINKEEKYYDVLRQELKRRGWTGSAEALLGDSHLLLQQLPHILKNQTVFLYLDPFGPTGCDFALLEPFLRRSQAYSTEILLTMSMPVIHRLAARKAVRQGRQDEEQIRGFHQTLTNVFGGEYWKDIMWNEELEAEEREIQLIEAYCGKLKGYLAFTGYCPVRERTSTRIKYFIVFASRYKDTMLLLNDIMLNAYFANIHKADFVGGLWEDTDWREMRSISGLDRVVMDIVSRYQGETRKDIWLKVVRQHFMRYRETEFNEVVQRLLDQKKLTSPTPHATKRINGACVLYLNSP